MRLLLSFLLTLAAGISAVYKAPSSLERVFKAYNIVPQVIPVAPDSQIITIYTDGDSLSPGDRIRGSVFAAFPYLTWSGSEDDLYVLIVTDLDVPQVYTGNGNQCLTNCIVNIANKDVRRGEAIIGSVIPTPLPGSGYHRYPSLIYKQEQPINVTTDLLIRISTDPCNFSITEFVNEFRLGDPVAGNLALSKSTLCEPKEEKYCNIDCQ